MTTNLREWSGESATELTRQVHNRVGVEKKCEKMGAPTAASAKEQMMTLQWGKSEGVKDLTIS